MGDGRVIVVGPGGEERVVGLAGPMQEAPLRVGDAVRLDGRSGLIHERLVRPEVEELVLEEIPDITYEQIGGLGPQIETIRDAVELPYLHKQLFEDYELSAPKGVLLYGPPGCGKTLIAKAVANSLARAVAAKTGSADARSYFLNVKGPELLNKYVGETERQIRLIFARAKEKSDEGVPVIVFFDEMDSLFRTRGSGVSSDVESTVVPAAAVGARRRRGPQERHRDRGLEPRGPHRPGHPAPGAPRREDQDRAARRRGGPGDLRHLPAATGAGARRTSWPPPGATATALLGPMIDAGGRRHVRHRRREPLPRGDLRQRRQGDALLPGLRLGGHDRERGAPGQAGGHQAGDRRGPRGVGTADLVEAVRQEFREHEDLPNTTNPDDWARISGKKGERIVYVRTLVGGDTPHRSIEAVSTGQYL